MVIDALTKDSLKDSILGKMVFNEFNQVKI
jgi:hypothetical protein